MNSLSPRPLIDWVDLEDPIGVQWGTLAATRHGHVPLCRRQLDEVVGMLLVRQVVPHLVADLRPDLASLAQPALFLPEHLPAFKALERFRQAGLRAALVVNEHGSVVGLLPPTHVLEAPAGDAAPISGNASSMPLPQPDGSWQLEGIMPLDEVADMFGLPAVADANRNPIQTLGGLTMAQLGRIPAPGDQVVWRGLHLEVLDMVGRRVNKVLATRTLQDPLKGGE